MTWKFWITEGHQRVSQPPYPATIEVDDYSSDLEDLYDALKIENGEIFKEEDEIQELKDRQEEDNIVYEEFELSKLASILTPYLVQQASKK
jgi:hypothetical protein